MEGAQSDEPDLFLPGYARTRSNYNTLELASSLDNQNRAGPFTSCFLFRSPPQRFQPMLRYQTGYTPVTDGTNFNAFGVTALTQLH